MQYDTLVAAEIILFNQIVTPYIYLALFANTTVRLCAVQYFELHCTCKLPYVLMHCAQEVCMSMIKEISAPSRGLDIYFYFGISDFAMPEYFFLSSTKSTSSPKRSQLFAGP